VICGSDQSRDLRRINATGKSVETKEFVSTEQQLLSPSVPSRSNTYYAFSISNTGDMGDSSPPH
jgi:hypothetical protein